MRAGGVAGRRAERGRTAAARCWRQELLISNYWEESPLDACQNWSGGLSLDGREFKKGVFDINVEQGGGSGGGTYPRVKAAGSQGCGAVAAWTSRLKHKAGIPEPHDVIVNDWSAWVFGPEPARKSAGIAVYAPGELAEKLSDLGVRPMPGKEEMAAAGPAVFVCRALSEEILTAVESGSSAVLLSRSGSDVQPLLPVVQLAYQTGWWNGRATWERWRTITP